LHTDWPGAVLRTMLLHGTRAVKRYFVRNMLQARGSRRNKPGERQATFPAGGTRKLRFICENSRPSFRSGLAPTAGAEYDRKLLSCGMPIRSAWVSTAMAARSSSAHDKAAVDAESIRRMGLSWRSMVTE
jgi:hypothetical protein